MHLMLLDPVVWDSSIVMAKYFERWNSLWAGKRCLDLSAGCGLVGANGVCNTCVCTALRSWLTAAVTANSTFQNSSQHIPKQQTAHAKTAALLWCAAAIIVLQL